MDTLPCQCAGLRINKCRCKVLHTGYRCDESGSYLVLAKSRSLDRYLNLGEKNPNVVLRFIENFYEQCAGYNLRYCHIRGFIRHDNCFSNTLKDCMILACFLIANFIVLLAILSKTLVHLYFVIVLTFQWIKRTLCCKLDTDQDTMILRPSVRHDYSPPLLNKYF
ncbi:uncharacterized protein LOC113503743 [Trichoplusia ni]|uniref:Uncharacterized protein LOC113503743 n=1 Tax=Trichoplusia ni TaxID=7111 RepID=A0A7E5WNC0_TRINI|nr:uncharacterized protein LOC113503743 [Trichoplusia ni]